MNTHLSPSLIQSHRQCPKRAWLEFHGDVEPQASIGAQVSLYKSAVAAYEQSDDFGPADIAYRVRELGLIPTLNEMLAVCETIKSGRNEYGDSMLDEPTPRELTLSIDAAAEREGVLDGLGDCPICGRNGRINSEKHFGCFVKLMEDTHGLCRCGQSATNTRYWIPMCQSCCDHEDHLDAI